MIVIRAERDFLARAEIQGCICVTFPLPGPLSDRFLLQGAVFFFHPGFYRVFGTAAAPGPILSKAVTRCDKELHVRN